VVLIFEGFVAKTEATSQPQGRDSEMRQLKERQIGAVPMLATAEAYLGELPSSEMLTMAISFEANDEAGLQRLIDELYDPASPRFHKWITPEEFGERFGRSKAEFDQAVEWLKAQGFEIVQP